MSLDGAALFRALRSSARPHALLEPSIARSSFEQVGSSALLRCTLRRLLETCQMNVAVIGGSISAGSTYSAKFRGANWLYHQRLAAVLRHVCPNGANVTVRNAAVPATGPGFFEICISDLLGDELLGSGNVVVVLELAINTVGDLPAFERLVRRLLARRPQPAIIVLNAHLWPLADPAGTRHARLQNVCFRVATAKQLARSAADGQPLNPGNVNATWLSSNAQRSIQTWNDTGMQDDDEDRIAEICATYHLPLVSMRAALLQPVRAGSAPLHQLRAFMVDCKHPNEQGHVLLAQMLLSRLVHAADAAPERAPCEVAPSLMPSATASAMARRDLPQAVYASSGVAQAGARCVTGSALSSLLAATPSGFTATAGRKPGLLAQRAGSVATFCLLRQASVAALTRLGSVWVGYLQSNSGRMGRASVSCAGSCNCTKLSIEGHTPAVRSVTQVKRLPLWAASNSTLASPRTAPRTASPPVGSAASSCCQVSVRVQQESTTNGHDFKLTAVIHSPASYGTSRGKGVPEPEQGTAKTEADRRIHRKFKNPARRTRDVYIGWGVGSIFPSGNALEHIGGHGHGFSATRL